MKTLLFILTLLTATASLAKLVKKEITYKDGEAELQGYMVYDDKFKAPMPGVLVVHDWMGVTSRTQEKADQVAALGYVAFAADVYGKGIRPTSPQEASAQATKYKEDRKLYRSRLNAALKTLQSQKKVSKKLAAIGYCFGGTGVIELARSGAAVAGVVSFHGGLDAPNPADGKNIKAKVLALHGADDPFEKPEDLNAFEKEMRDNKIDWRLVKYGGAVHSFTDKSAGHDNSKGAAYNESADKHSWIEMKEFFKEIL
jgi:dienelactone hydrolase